MSEASEPRAGLRSAGRTILLGVLTAAPLAITWLIVEFLFRQLSALGRPIVAAASRWLNPEQPALARLLAHEGFLSVLAAASVVGLLWLLGSLASRVVGQRLIAVMEALINRIPLVHSIYTATKRFLNVAGTTPEGSKRVVLIDFPSPEMKALGLVTRVIRDADTGEELAVVYVPTSPNPTSGYIEIVPVRRLTWTDWSFDEAMAFIVTGGANAPGSVAYHRRHAPEGG